MKKFKVKSKHKNNIKRSRKTLILCGKEKKSIFEDWIKIIIRYVSYLTAFFPKIQQLSLISYNKIYNCLAKLHLQTWIYITQLTSKIFVWKRKSKTSFTWTTTVAVPILSWKFSSSMGLGLLLLGSMGTTPIIVLANVLRFSRRDLMSAILQNWESKHNIIKLFLKSYSGLVVFQFLIPIHIFSLYLKSLLTSTNIFLWNCRSMKIIMQLYKKFKPAVKKWIKIWPSSYYKHIKRTFFSFSEIFCKDRYSWLYNDSFIIYYVMFRIKCLRLGLGISREIIQI